MSTVLMISNKQLTCIYWHRWSCDVTTLDCPSGLNGPVVWCDDLDITVVFVDTAGHICVTLLLSDGIRWSFTQVALHWTHMSPSRMRGLPDACAISRMHARSPARMRSFPRRSQTQPLAEQLHTFSYNSNILIDAISAKILFQ